MSASFSYKITTENEQFTFNFSTVMSTGETISLATSTVEVVSGTDASPTAILVGSPVINGQVVSQRISGGLDGVIYRIEVTVTTSATNVFTIVADLPVLSPLNV
jgi:hypothetical protein